MAYQLKQADQLQSIKIWEPVLNPAEAEIFLTFTLRSTPRDPEFRGRLMGPRCPYASTVEIAYYFRQAPSNHCESSNMVTGRVVIPEPSLWDPISPFLYQGPLEIWAEGKPLIQIQVSHGLHAMHVSKAGLLWNGNPLRLIAHDREQLPDDLANLPHQSAYNTIILPISEITPALLQLTDRYGLLVLARLEKLPEDSQRFWDLAEHVSFLGWILSEALCQQVGTDVLKKVLPREKQLVGLELSSPTACDIQMSMFSFICCGEDQQAQLSAEGIPLLIRVGPGRNGSGQLHEDKYGLLGTVHQS